MHAISVQQPNSWAILRGGKDVENRHNRKGQLAARAQFNHSGRRLALHAGLRYAGADAFRKVQHLASVAPEDPGTPKSATEWAFGAFIGMVHLESVHIADECYDPVTGRFCSPWAEPNAAHLVLADPQILHRPVYAPGRLGLWEITDTDVVAAITRQAS